MLRVLHPVVLLVHLKICIFDCPVYTYTRKQSPGLIHSYVVLIGQILNQPDCNRVAKFLTQVKARRMSLA